MFYSPVVNIRSLLSKIEGEFLLESLQKILFKNKFMRMKKTTNYGKVEKILKGSLHSIPSPLVKIQIMDGKICLMCKGKTLLGVVDKLLKKTVC